MTDRINKPKVFLSHSSLDKAFIERLANDLRKCQVEYWLDTEEMRDGRSWLKVIFEDGMPTCDAVIVYLTEHSIDSKMVEKELDAAVVEQLTEGGIALLPYISRADLRDRLRIDIRTLHCREWNDSNYLVMLPSVVAEIWRSFLERTVETSVLQEKNRRLELELELNRLKEHYQSSVFTPRENQEFQYLLKKLDRKVDVKVGLSEKQNGTDSTVGSAIYSISFLSLLLDLIDSGYVYYEHYSLKFPPKRLKERTLSLPNHPEVQLDNIVVIDEALIGQFSIDLTIFGLTQVTRIQRFDRWETAHPFSEKMYRFKYWLDYNDLTPNEDVNPIIRMESEKSIGVENEPQSRLTN